MRIKQDCFLGRPYASKLSYVINNWILLIKMILIAYEYTITQCIHNAYNKQSNYVTIIPQVMVKYDPVVSRDEIVLTLFIV